MTNSSRHHYIPRFLIDNFADYDNKVWVYNKEKNHVVNTKQSSKSIFFERHRNTFDVNGELVDNIEKMYSEVDSLLAKNLAKVISTHSMTGRELTLLIFLVSLIKWRVPASDESFYKHFKNIPIEQLGLAIRPVDKNAKVETHVINKISEMDIVKEVKRLLLPVQPLISEVILNEIHKNCFIVSNEEFPSLLGDVPIIENPNNSYEKLEDFIFPLSSYETLVCKRNAEKRVSQKIFYFQKDLTIFHLSKKYVVCKSQEHLINISEIYSKLVNENKAHLLTKYVFNFIK